MKCRFSFQKLGWDFDLERYLHLISKHRTSYITFLSCGILVMKVTEGKNRMTELRKLIQRCTGI